MQGLLLRSGEKDCKQAWPLNDLDDAKKDGRLIPVPVEINLQNPHRFHLAAENLAERESMLNEFPIFENQISQLLCICFGKNYFKF